MGVGEAGQGMGSAVAVPVAGEVDVEGMAAADARHVVYFRPTAGSCCHVDQLVSAESVFMVT